MYKNIKIHIYIKNKYVLKFHSERFNQGLSFNLNIILFCFFSIEIKMPIKKKTKEALRWRLEEGSLVR